MQREEIIIEHSQLVLNGGSCVGGGGVGDECNNSRGGSTNGSGGGLLDNSDGSRNENVQNENIFNKSHHYTQVRWLLIVC